MLIHQVARKNDLPRIQGPDVGMEVRHVSFMRSDRGKNGMIYTQVGGADLSVLTELTPSTSW